MQILRDSKRPSSNRWLICDAYVHMNVHVYWCRHSSYYVCVACTQDLKLYDKGSTTNIQKYCIWFNEVLCAQGGQVKLACSEAPQGLGFIQARSCFKSKLMTVTNYLHHGISVQKIIVNFLAVTNLAFQLRRDFDRPWREEQDRPLHNPSYALPTKRQIAV